MEHSDKALKLKNLSNPLHTEKGKTEQPPSYRRVLSFLRNSIRCDFTHQVHKQFSLFTTNYDYTLSKFECSKS